MHKGKSFDLIQMTGICMITALLILPSSSCKKDHADSPDIVEPSPVIIDTNLVTGEMNDPGQIMPPDTIEYTLDSTFIIGIDTGFIKVVTVGESPLQGIQISAPWNYYEAYYLDIDNDLTDDIELICSHGASPGGEGSSSGINILNDSFSISSKSYLDSIFFCDTSISGQYYGKYLNSFTYDGCGGGPQNSFHHSRTVYHPKIHEKGDTLNNTEYWRNSDLGFASESITSDEVSYYFKLKFWNSYSPKYVLIRKTTNNGYLYGWLKIKVSGISTIYFYEYAFQTF